MHNAQAGDIIEVKIDADHTPDRLEVVETQKILLGYVSFETAYVQHDYPFGRFHRCPMLYWIERATKGAKRNEYRFMRVSPHKSWLDGYSDAVENDQAVRYYTDNPPPSWNKAKGSNYSFWMGMVLQVATDSDGNAIRPRRGCKDEVAEADVLLGPSYVTARMYGSPEDWFRIRCRIRSQYLDAIGQHDTNLLHMIHEQNVTCHRDMLSSLPACISQAFNGERNLWAIEQYLRKQEYYQDWFNDFDRQAVFVDGNVVLKNGCTSTT